MSVAAGGSAIIRDVRAVPAAGPASFPLAPDQLADIAQARARGRKVNRAATVAAFSGWSTAVLAFLTLLGGLFSLPALALGASMAGVAMVELRGARALRRLDPAAPKRLALNQLALFLMVGGYSIWCVAQALLAPGPYEPYLAAGGQVADMLEPIARLHATVTIVFYSALLVCSAIAQGLAAVYYVTRRRHIDDFLDITPPWVVHMLRTLN